MEPSKEAPPPSYTSQQQPPPQGYAPPPQGYPPQQGYPPPQQGYAQPGYPATGGYPQGYAPGPAPATTVTIVNAGPACLRDMPCTMQCQFCQAHMTTYLTMDACSGLAWLICLVLLLVGLGLCSWIPFLIPSCQDVEHHCGNCNRVVGTYKRL